MEILIKQTGGKCLVTKREVLNPFYDVFVDGVPTAIVGFEMDSKIIFTRTGLSPMLKDQVCEYVKDQLALSEVNSTEPTDVKKILEDFEAEQEGDDFHEFD